MKPPVIRKPCTATEKLIAKKLSTVICLPGSFDKRFIRSMVYAVETAEGITDKQRELLFIMFRRYRRQIKDYDEINIALNPDEYQVITEFTLFGMQIRVKKVKPPKKK